MSSLSTGFPDIPDQNAGQQPQQSQQPSADPLDQLKSNIVRQYQELQPKATSGGRIKQMLQNFVGGMGQSMMHEAGLPTTFEKQQKLLGDVQNITAAQANVELHKAMASQYAPVPLIGLDGKPTTDAQGNPITLPAIHAQTYYAGQLAAAQRLESTRDQVQGKIDVANIMQGGGLQLPVSQSTAELAGAPELAGKTLGMGGWKMLNSALRARGFHVQDMGTSGPTAGMWVVDNQGNKVHQVSPNSLIVTRGKTLADERAAVTPFETVEPGTNIPTTISNLQAIRTGAPKVPIATQQKLGGQYALYNDAYGILDKIDSLADQVNLDDPSVRARVTAGYAAIKDPSSRGLTGEVLSNFLARQPINNQLTSQERELILTMGQGKSAGMGLRGILGQAGANEMQQRMDAALFPGGQAVGSKASVKQQTAATRALLGRLSVGQPQVGLNAPGQPSALANRGPNAPAVEFREGSDTYRIPADKVQAFRAKHPQAVPSGR